MTGEYRELSKVQPRMAPKRLYTNTPFATLLLAAAGLSSKGIVLPATLRFNTTGHRIHCPLILRFPLQVPDTQLFCQGK